jgi:hypothetical protein
MSVSATRSLDTSKISSAIETPIGAASSSE